jgi:hypothetical protein
MWSDTPPPPEAPAALLELAAQVQQDAGGIQLPERASIAAQVLDSRYAAEALAAAQQQQQQQQAAANGGAADGSGECCTQKHRATVAGLMKKATDDARACGLADPSVLVTQLMSILDEHVAALSQLESPGTQLAVASAGGVTVELPDAPSVGGTPEATAATAAPGDQCAVSKAQDAAAAAAAAAGSDVDTAAGAVF